MPHTLRSPKFISNMAVFNCVWTIPCNKTKYYVFFQLVRTNGMYAYIVGVMVNRNKVRNFAITLKLR